MNILVKSVGSTALALALAAIAAPAFASTGPAFKTLGIGSGMSVDAFTTDVNVFNNREIGDLVHAKSIAVLNVDNAWTDNGDASKAFNAIDNSDQAIHLLREHLRADPAAMRLLAANHVDVNRVVDITSSGNGSVQLYVS